MSLTTAGILPETAARTTRDPITLRTLQRMVERDEPFACLAAYDATTARLLETAGVHLLLLGDSAAQVILGHDTTNAMPFEVTIALTAALKRGAPSCYVMSDMPFGTYGISDTETLSNAARLMTEGLADCIKIETGMHGVGTVAKLTQLGVPVCAHIGLKPTQAGLDGGYRAKGRSAEEAIRIVREARALEEAGAVMILLEAVPPRVAEAVVESVRVPVIGIGCGPAPHGQILVVHDLLGLSVHPPRFAEQATDAVTPILDAGRAWVERVGTRTVGGQTYRMPDEELHKFEEDLDRG